MTPAPAQLRAVGKRYDRGGWALRGVDLDIRAGEILGVVGANGSGKSTLLSLVAGRARPTEGELLLFGRPVQAYPSRALRRSVGLVSQDLALDPEMTAAETLRFFAALYGGSSREAIAGVVQDFGLADFLHVPLARVSGGQRQRVNLALGVLQQPALLLFDEPTNALDPMTRQTFWQGLEKALNPHRALVVATHHLQDAEAHCHRLAVLAGGRLVALDTPGALLHDTGCGSFEDAFFHLTGERMTAPRSSGPGKRKRMGGAW